MVSYRGSRAGRIRVAEATRNVLPSEALVQEPNPVIFDAEGRAFHLRTSPFAAPLDER